MAICLGLALAVQIKPYAHAWITDARANIAIQSFQVERALQRLTAKSPHANDDDDEGGVIFVFVFCVFVQVELLWQGWRRRAGARTRRRRRRVAFLSEM